MPSPVHPIIGSNVFVPARLLTREGAQDIRRELVANYFNQETRETTPVVMYRETSGGVYLPRAWVRDRLPKVWASAFNNTTAPEVGEVWPTGAITPRDQDQAEFMAKVSKLVARGVAGEIIDDQIEASTGTGKTAAMLKAACDNNITNVLVTVHRNNLKEQWIGNAELRKGMRYFFGEKWVRKNVGIVQQDVFDWQKPITVAMAPTLCSRKFPKEFYDRFGLVFVDEDHKFAAPMLQQVLSMFRAGVRIGATATLKQGEMGKVVTYHLGKPSVVSKQKPMKAIVKRLRNKQEVSFWNYANDAPAGPIPNVQSCDNQRMLATLVPRLHDRNEFLADIIYERGYNLGRNGVVLSDRVQHLQHIRQLVIDRGADPEQCGLYVGEYDTGKFKLTGSVYTEDDKGKKVAKHFRGLDGFTTRARAISYANKAKKELSQAFGVPMNKIDEDFRIQAERYKPNEEDRKHMEQNCQFLFATYGVFDTGTDVDRLDWGMELLPHGDVTQALGRILRIMPGKPEPVWYSIEDEFYQTIQFMEKPMLYHYSTPKRLAASRIKSYNQQNADIIYIGNPRNALAKAKEAEKVRASGR